MQILVVLVASLILPTLVIAALHLFHFKVKEERKDDKMMIDALEDLTKEQRKTIDTIKTRL
jgi:hypothetical protein